MRAIRFYKRWTHEGGIATPLVVHWPNGKLVPNGIVRTAFQLTDVMPTILQATGADYPRIHGGREYWPAKDAAFFLHCAGKASPTARSIGSTRATARFAADDGSSFDNPGPWELYDMSRDRTETHDVSTLHPQVVEELTDEWDKWPVRVGVIPWSTTLEIYRNAGWPENEAAG